ncbi:MAG: response regulator [Phycisphaerales bacterium]|nr:response regulator [Phycisphaerales bacterium]
MPSVLDVGNCDPDHAAIRAMLTRHFRAEVRRVMFVEEALAALQEREFALVLVNRRIFADDSDGMELIRRMKADPALAALPVMLVSNYPDAQAAAVAAGAEPGFGKAALNAPQTLARIAAHLPQQSAGAA